VKDRIALFDSVTRGINDELSCCALTHYRDFVDYSTVGLFKVDELNGKITIQQTQSGTVGANTGGATDDFKVQDGLLFNAVQPGDKVIFTATEIGGVKTITKLEKQ
jgi:Cu/Ag efflux protein CusF